MNEESPTTPPRFILFPDDQIGGYEITSLVREGGWGRLYVAIRETNRERYAFKTIRPDLAEEPAFRRRFKEEQTALKRLQDHPNLRPAVDWNHRDEGILWLTVPWIDGPTLHGLVSEGPLPAERAVDLIAQAAEGLYAVHTGPELVHRDLHPGNLMVEAGDRLRVIDFGLAKRFNHSSGSPFLPERSKWSSPEALRGGSLTPAADIYSLGLVLAYVMTGREPEDNSPVLPADIEVPPGVCSVIERATQKRKKNRYLTAREMSAALRESAQSASLSYRVAPRPSPSARKGTPRRVALGPVLLVAITAAVATFLLAAFLPGNGESSGSARINTGGLSVEVPRSWTRSPASASDHRLGMRKVATGPSATVLLGSIPRGQLPARTPRTNAYEVGLPAGRAMRLDDSEVFDARRMFVFRVEGDYPAIICRGGRGENTKSVERTCGRIAATAKLRHRSGSIPYPKPHLRRQAAESLHLYAAARRNASEAIEAAETHQAVAEAADAVAKAASRAAASTSATELAELHKALEKASNAWNGAAEAAREGAGYHEAGQGVLKAEKRIREARLRLLRFGFRRR